MNTQVPVDGGFLAAESTGSGAPVVLLHAGVGDRRMYDSVVEKLANRFHLIRYDSRGFGESPPPTVSFSRLDDLNSVLDHFQLHRAHLVGCSMGGETAIDYALAHPDRVASLLLLAPGLSGYDWPDHPDDPDEAAAKNAVAQGDIDTLAVLIIRHWGAADPDPELDPFILEQARSAARGWLTEEFEQQHPPAVDRLGEITQPTVLAIGDRDDPDLYPVADLILSGIPGARRVDLPGVDHYVPIRAPQLVSDLIAEQASG